MKKGFTLIELLAVIVILAIIALIAVPIILNLVNNSKKEAAKASAEKYLDAVELSFQKEKLNNSLKNFNGTYTITENGEMIIGEDGSKLSVEFDGEGITSGILKIENGRVISIFNGRINKWYVKMISNEIFILSELSTNTLVSGQEFNTAIKTLVAGSDVQYNTSDKTITSITLNVGFLPEGYTKETLSKLENVDVSEKQDKSIIAYYDGNETVHIYSDDNISANKDSSYMFYNFTSLKKIDSIYLYTSTVTNMKYMFYNCNVLKELDVSNFETSDVTDMSYMFSGCNRLTKLDLSNFETSNVTNMSYMFERCVGLTKLYVSNFRTSNVTNMALMFSNLSNLSSLSLKGWDMSKVTNVSGMFSGLSNLTELDMSESILSNTMKFSNTGLSNSTKSKTINLSNADTSKVTDMSSMFSGLTYLTSINLSGCDLSNVTNVSNMFYNLTGLTELNMSECILSNAIKFSSAGLSNSTKLKTINLYGVDTSKMTDMSGMFSGLSLTNLDLSDFDTKNVQSTLTMFLGNTGLTELNLKGWNMSNITNMNGMFAGLTNLTELNLSNWTFSNIVKFNNTGLLSSTKLKTINFSGADTSKMTDMSSMFAGLTNLTSLDLKSFNTTNVTNMNSMFNGTTNLKCIQVGGNWTTKNVTSNTNMFYNSGTSSVATGECPQDDSTGSGSCTYTDLSSYTQYYKSMSSGTSYYYYDTATYSSNSYALSDPTLYTWDSTNYQSIVGKYTAMSSSAAASGYSTIPFITSANANGFYYVVVSGGTLGKTCVDCVQKFSNMTKSNVTMSSSTVYYFSDKVTYSNGQYTLVNPQAYTWGTNYASLVGKYTSMGYSSGSWSSIPFVIATSSSSLEFVTLSGGTVCE